MKSHLFIFLIFMFITNSLNKNTRLSLESPESETTQINFISGEDSFNLINLNNGTMMLSNQNDNSKVFSLNSLKSLEFNYPLKLDTQSIDLVMKYTDSKLSYDNEDQWTMIKLDDFQGEAEGWSKDKLSTCGPNNNMFLGGYCNFAKDEAKKTYKDLPSHNWVRITANFHFFDQWLGEEAYMNFDGNPVWTDTYKWCDKVFQWFCKKYAINACGAEYPDRLSVPIDFTSI
jgi:hypothetical protein